jgi:hypothetical protein
MTPLTRIGGTGTIDHDCRLASSWGHFRERTDQCDELVGRDLGSLALGDLRCRLKDVHSEDAADIPCSLLAVLLKMTDVHIKELTQRPVLRILSGAPRGLLFSGACALF